MEPEKAVCPVCGATDSNVLRKYRYQNAIFAGCSLVGCDRCGMVFAHPVPSEEELRQYNEGYFDNAHGGIATHPLTTAFYSAISRLRMEYVEAYLGRRSLSAQHILEIGPGTGYFAKHWLEKHPSAYYAGVESDASCYSNLEKYGVHVYPTLDSVPQEQRFGLVVISHVLEHTTDPAGFLSACTEWLSPGGVLFIEVPCNDYQHKSLDEPHLLFFDKGPMGLLLDTVGFRDIQLSYHGNTIESLKQTPSFFQRFEKRLRNFLLNRGFVSWFSSTEKGMERMSDPLERAVIKPFGAHMEQPQPAWWLRAIAIKK